MKIIKSTGELVEFNPDKIKNTLVRTGASPEIIERVLARVLDRVTDGMTTRQLFNVVRRELRKEGPHLAHRYGLRAAILKLGPTGFKFEQYVSSILNAYQYTTSIPPQDFSGLCVNHEVDVIAQKDERSIMIEAKFRNNFGDTVKLKDVMATWSRFVDLSDGYRADKRCPYFEEIWIVTNGKFSDRALQFGLCKGIHLIGWSNGDSLAKLVDHATLYPITAIDGLRPWELERFVQHQIILCREVAAADPAHLAGKIGLPLDRMKKIWDQCQAIVG